MKLATSMPPLTAATPRTRAADYLELTKPRVAVLVLFTVAAGAMLAGGGSVHLPVLLHTLFGTALVAAGASALNQLLERQSDAVMRRTENRPLPAGRLHPLQALVFGCALGLAGVVYLAATLQRPWAALVAAITFISYVCVYTPLKRRTPLNTLVGAIPGALPPVIGWVAVRGSVEPETLVLFCMVFLWQVPHFLAIAWIHRDDYARARLRMLPVADHNGTRTGRQMVTYGLALIPVSVAPVFLFGGAGVIYLVGAILLGFGFLWNAAGFTRNHSNAQARRVLRASLVYLPALLALLVLDGLLSGK